MNIFTTIQRAWRLVWDHPYVWLLVLLAVLGDLWAILDYNPNSPNLSHLIIWVSLFTFIAETGVIYALVRHDKGETSSFVDAIMSAVTSLGTLGAKAVMMIIPAFFFVLFAILSSPLHVIFEDIQFPILFAILLLPLLFLMQIWTPFTSCGLLIQQYSVSESMTHAWRIIWSKKKTLMQIAFVFILIDIFLIFMLYQVGGISFRSAFIYTVTEEMARMNVQFETGGHVLPGEYFAINRPIAGLMATILKARGIDLLSIPTYFIDKKLIGMVTVFVSMILLPLRLSVLAIAYNEWAEPVREFSDEEKSFWKEQKFFQKKHNR